MEQSRLLELDRDQNAHNTTFGYNNDDFHYIRPVVYYIHIGLIRGWSSIPKAETGCNRSLARRRL